MIPVPQRIVGSGKKGDAHGDCWKCCVASILELRYEDVPHFGAGEWLHSNPGGEPYRADIYSSTDDWMKHQGWPMSIVTERFYKPSDQWPQDPESAGPLALYEPRDVPPWHRGYWIAAVLSENYEGCTHAVVMRKNSVAFDPSTFPRRTPYRYVGQSIFVVTDPVAVRRHAWLAAN